MKVPRILKQFQLKILTLQLRFLIAKMNFRVTQPGSLDLDPGSHGKPMNSWCVSFETECNNETCHCVIRCSVNHLHVVHQDLLDL